jgi:site-specific DNA-methyltransferase (adenine-specific)
MVKSGWDFHQDIVWHKCTAGVKRAGVVIQKPFPGYYYPNIMTEYILVFRKPGPPMYRSVDDETRQASKVTINQMFTREIANNVWHIAPVPPRTIEHPCPYPEEIPYRLIQLYSYRGDVVLDPFVGSGQTTKVAHQLGRVGIGYDIQEKYVEMSTRRLEEPLSIRPNQLIAVFDKIELELPLGERSANGHGPRRARRRPNGSDGVPPIPGDGADLQESLNLTDHPG